MSAVALFLLCLIASPLLVIAAYVAGITARFIFERTRAALERHRWRQLKKLRNRYRAYMPVEDDRSSLLTFRRIHERQGARRG